MKQTAYSRVLGTCVLLGTLAVGACSDGPSGPSKPRAAAVEAAVSQSGHTAAVGADVAVAPAVLVRDALGLPVAGVTVKFAIVAGGGSLGAASAVTGADGVASAGRWTLGTAAGVNEVAAIVGTLPEVRFTATAVSPPVGSVPSSSAYNVTIRYVSTATARQRQAVEYAVNRWRSVIVGDLPNVSANAAAGTCFAGQPALNEVIDDILIFVDFADIDGPGKVLGEAGPCFVRTSSSLPVIGSLRLDNADLEQMERVGTLDDVVTHEIGHILGFGTVWSSRHLVSGSGGEDPHFTGQHAVAEYRAIGGTMAGVPVENTGSTGTRDSHWRESLFGNELMTGYISGVPNPLSAMTVASLRDLGYNASTAGASTYALGGVPQRLTSASIDLRGRERVLKPKYDVDPHGRKTRLPDDPK